jgi:hypothetical protein
MSWQRCKRGRCCVICDKPDWCCFTEDGAARCMRIHEPPAGWYICKQDEHGGTTFRPGDKPPRGESKRVFEVKPPPLVKKRKNWDEIQGILFANTDYDALQLHADSLGLSPVSLSAIGIGYHNKWECWTFPMYNDLLQCVGIRCRDVDGKKWAIPGSSDGVFCNVIPVKVWRDEVFICEGPTDTAAMWDIGLFAIGRPSCRGAVITVKKLLKGRAAVVVSDADGPGREGAEHLADNLIGVASSVKVIEPPCKDMREWKERGTNEAAVRLLVDNAKERRNGKKQVQRSTG